MAIKQADSTVVLNVSARIAQAERNSLSYQTVSVESISNITWYSNRYCPAFHKVTWYPPSNSCLIPKIRSTCLFRSEHNNPQNQYQCYMLQHQRHVAVVLNSFSWYRCAKLLSLAGSIFKFLGWWYITNYHILQNRKIHMWFPWFWAWVAGSWGL